MKAVVWTDVFQGAIMLIGIKEAGSMKRVFDIFKERERMTVE